MTSTAVSIITIPIVNLVYEESHSATTSQIGLVNLSIGEGTVMSGSFSTIDWGNHNYFIEVAVDINGGSNYIVMGSTQLRSVPYALYAENSGSSIPGPQGPIGLTGPAGANGIDGTYGVDGVDGAPGATGPAGAHGIDGTDGVDGVDGAQGPIGLTGPAGANGVDGVDGAQGPIGLTGPAGANGIDGTDGVDGIDGAAGATGPQGPIGLTGPAGANGIDGVDGTDCCNAIDSLSQVVSNLDSTLTSITSLFVFGCMDTAAFNYNPLANVDDNSCVPIITGCTDTVADNYNASANTDDSSCYYIGCTDNTALNYDPTATVNNGCIYPFSGAIGDTYQGGIVFWLDGNGGGLIAAPTDQAIGAEWGCYGNAIAGADGTAIGTGAQNTIDIETGCTSSGIAADLCANLTLGGYSDWFLPSKDELSQMYFNLHQQGLGGFSNFYYWSSSEAAYNNAWVRRFANGYLDVANKNLTTLYVRAVRAF